MLTLMAIVKLFTMLCKHCEGREASRNANSLKIDIEKIYVESMYR